MMKFIISFSRICPLNCFSLVFAIVCMYKDLIKHLFRCQTCTLCLYCNEDCRRKSWIDCHKWECVGMQANIWYDLGIAFAAFKAICKGLRSRFADASKTSGFGSKEDNYPHFNTLLSHLHCNEHLDSMALVSFRNIALVLFSPFFSVGN